MTTLQTEEKSSEKIQNVIPIEEKQEKTLIGQVIDNQTPREEEKVIEPRKRGRPVKSPITISEKKTLDVLEVKKEEFIPTPHMDRWLTTAVNLMSDNVSEISKASHVSRVSYYGWLRMPGFREWYYSQYKAKRYLWIPKLDKMGMERAPKNFDYWKAMNQKAGDLLDDAASKQPQQVISILGGMTVNNITKDS